MSLGRPSLSAVCVSVHFRKHRKKVVYVVRFAKKVRLGWKKKIEVVVHKHELYS